MSPSPLSTIPGIEAMYHEQESLISALTTDIEEGEAGASPDNDAVSTVVGASTLISTASSKTDSSEYFKREPIEDAERHTYHANDSLCYSADNSLTSSYLGSVVRSLDAQQAFPSSMFPGQKLISPSSARKTADIPLSGPNSRMYPSYYYYSSAPDKDINGNEESMLSMPVSYQNSSTYILRQQLRSNVYHKQSSTRSFWDNHEDVDADLDDDEHEPSWKRCWRCFFHPRVFLTVAVCGIIIINLLRMGPSQHHRLWSSENGGDGRSVDFRLETIRDEGTENLFDTDP